MSSSRRPGNGTSSAIGTPTGSPDIQPVSDEPDLLTPSSAEDYHQQYLARVRDGYCGVGGTGVTCPIGTGVESDRKVLRKPVHTLRDVVTEPRDPARTTIGVAQPTSSRQVPSMRR
jgi:hypothetical protein